MNAPDKAAALAHYVPMAEAAISNDVAAYERSLGQVITETHIELARDRVLSDVDSFVDSLAASCFGRTRACSDYATRMPGRLQRADVATVLHALLVAADRGDADTCLEAARELLQRHMSTRLVLVEAIAGQIARGEA